MDEEARPLHKVYTVTGLNLRALKLESCYSVENDSISITEALGQTNMKRILIKAKPGMGKSSTMSLLAFEWATGQSKLPRFDFVFLIPLKHETKGESIENFKLREYVNPSDFDLDEDTLKRHLQSDESRILLILDGLDEIDIRHHPEVDEILKGRKYKNCNVFVTSQPHAARKYENKMSSVVEIQGFSKAQAEKYVGHFLEDEDKRKFFRQLGAKNMNEMYKSPMILQALVMLFRENRDFPETLQAIYDKLHFFLEKTCVEHKRIKGSCFQGTKLNMTIYSNWVCCRER